MSDPHNKTPNTEKDLRHKAEAIVSELEKNKTGNTPVLQELPVTEIKQIVHELRVHQIQLEMQNEQLQILRGTSSTYHRSACWTENLFQVNLPHPGQRGVEHVTPDHVTQGTWPGHLREGQNGRSR